MRHFFVGVDFGTSIVKATAIDAANAECIQYSRAYKNAVEQTTARGWLQTFREVFTNLQDLLPTTSQIVGLSITGMVPNVCLVDGSDQEIGTILFCDDEAYDLERRLDQELKSPRWANEVLSKVILLSQRGHGAKWFTTHNWLTYKLTGQYALDAVTASETGSLLENHQWSAPTISRYGLTKIAFPKIVAPTTILGPVVDDLGLPGIRGVPVICGTSDTVATAMGAGLSENPTSLLVYYGTFNCAAVVTGGRSTILTSSSPRNPFEWILSVPRAGDQLRQIASILNEGASDQLAKFDELAASSPIGSNGLIFLHSRDLRQTTVSSRPVGEYRNINANVGKADLSRSVMEGFAFLLRHSMQSSSSATVEEAIVAGGGARSSIWRQIVSDVSGLTQKYVPRADRGLGSALLAAAAMDPDYQSALMPNLEADCTTTNPGPFAEYEPFYQAYLREAFQSP